MTLIKSISGIRGTIGGAPGENLTPLDLVKFTSAYGRWLRENNGAGRRLRVVVGRDARLSGEMAASIVTGTLCGCGIDVIDIGLATTPTVEIAVTGKGADGGIILTASHNPGQWNALKLLGSRGEFLSDAEGKRVLAIAADDAYDYPGVDALGHVVFRGSYDREHIDRVLALPLVDREAVRRAGFRVVVDAVNSVGGVVMPVLLRELGCEVVEMNCTPDGRFAHTPEPIPENLTDIAARVPSERADLGVVVDPDVDRLALVCEDGTMFGEEYTLVAVADYVLSHTKGPAVSNLSSSRALRDVAERHGCPYCAAAVGEVNVVAKMREVGAVIGGEGNGGVIYPEPRCAGRRSAVSDSSGPDGTERLGAAGHVSPVLYFQEQDRADARHRRGRRAVRDQGQVRRRARDRHRRREDRLSGRVGSFAQVQHRADHPHLQRKPRRGCGRGARSPDYGRYPRGDRTIAG